MPTAMAIMARRRKHRYRGPRRRRAVDRGAERVTPTPNRATIPTFPLFCCARFAHAPEGRQHDPNGHPLGIPWAIYPLGYPLGYGPMGV